MLVGFAKPARNFPVSHRRRTTSTSCESVPACAQPTARCSRGDRRFRRSHILPTARVRSRRSSGSASACSRRSSASLSTAASSGRRVGGLHLLQHPAGRTRLVASRQGLLAGDVALFPPLGFGGVAGLADRDRHQQPPELVATGQVKLAPLLAQAKALEHALGHVLLVGPEADSLVEILAGQRQQVAEIALPYQAGRRVAYDGVVGAQVRESSVTEPCGSMVGSRRSGRDRGEGHRMPPPYRSYQHSDRPPDTGRRIFWGLHQKISSSHRTGLRRLPLRISAR